MARIFITGSADGLGRLTAESLLDAGHAVIVHARSASRLEAVRHLLDRGATAIIGDLADRAQVRDIVAQVDASGPADAVIHNAGVYRDAPLLQVNVVAPYLLTALMPRPRRLIYISSNMHLSGRPRLKVFEGNGGEAATYSDTKLFVSTLAAAVARRWPDVRSHSVDPGWVPTKMGGRGAPDDLQEGYATQTWLAVSDDPRAKVSGRYFHHQAESPSNPQADDVVLQENFLSLCGEITDIAFPG